MDTALLYVVGTALVLIGFIGLIKTRFSSVRKRLDSASAIRSHARMGGSAMSTYQSNESAGWQLLSLAVMLLGGATVVVGVIFA